MTSSVTLIVWSVFAALVIASVITYTVERSLQLLAAVLLHENAEDASNAKTLRELGYRGIFLSVTALCASSGSRIARAIGKVNTEVPLGNNKEDGELLFHNTQEMRYYLPKDTIDKSLRKHLLADTPIWKLLAALIVLLLAALAATSVIRFLGRSASNVPKAFEHGVYGTENKQDSLLEEQEKQTQADIIEAEKAAEEAAKTAEGETDEDEVSEESEQSASKENDIASNE